MEKRDVFLCHAGEDKDEFVRPLAEQLRMNAITYWLDEAEIRWGDSITRKVNEGLIKSRFFIPFFTPAFYQRNFPETELYSTIDREIAENSTLILAILAIDPGLFKQRYPLLSSKRFMEMEVWPERYHGGIAQESGSKLPRALGLDLSGQPQGSSLVSHCSLPGELHKNSRIANILGSMDICN
jgi:hypothetical protein